MKPTDKPRRRQRRLLDKKAAYLAAFAACGHLADAAEAVGIDRGQHYDWLDNDAAYVAAFASAKKRAGHMLVDLAVRRVVKGVFVPTIYKGKFCYAPRKRTLCKLADGTSAFEDELPKKHPKILNSRAVITNDGEMIGVWEYSEGLHGKLLASLLPDEFGTQRSEVTGKDGVPLIPSGCTLIFGDGTDDDIEPWAGDTPEIPAET